MGVWLILECCIGKNHENVGFRRDGSPTDMVNRIKNPGWIWKNIFNLSQKCWIWPIFASVDVSNPSITGWDRSPSKIAPIHPERFVMIHECSSGWWCHNHLEKYEFVNGKNDIPYMKWKIKNVWNHQPDMKIATSLLLMFSKPWCLANSHFESQIQQLINMFTTTTPILCSSFCLAKLIPPCQKINKCHPSRFGLFPFLAC